MIETIPLGNRLIVQPGHSVRLSTEIPSARSLLATWILVDLESAANFTITDVLTDQRALCASTGSIPARLLSTLERRIHPRVDGLAFGNCRLVSAWFSNVSEVESLLAASLVVYERDHVPCLDYYHPVGLGRTMCPPGMTTIGVQCEGSVRPHRLLVPPDVLESFRVSLLYAPERGTEGTCSECRAADLLTDNLLAGGGYIKLEPNPVLRPGQWCRIVVCNTTREPRYFEGVILATK